MSTLNSYLKSIGAEVYTSDRENAGCLIITNAIGSKRWRMSKSLKDALQNPEAVELYFTSEALILIPVDKNAKNGITLRSGGYIYDSALTERLIQMSGTEIPAGKSRKNGTFTTNQLEDGSIYAEVKFS